MSDRLRSIVEDIPLVAGAAELKRLLLKIRKLYDVDNCIYYALSLGGPQAGAEFGAMTYPEAWHERYEAVRYRDFDPVVLAAKGRFVPLDWASLDWTGRPVRRLLAEASEHRVGNNGYTVPIHGPNGQFAMFTVTKHCTPDIWTKLLLEWGQEFLVIAHHVHRQALEINGADESAPPPMLSPRERDALSLMSMGRSRAQIADKLKISESTLRVYLDNARHKLGGLNAFHAVAIAVRNGSIKV